MKKLIYIFVVCISFFVSFFGDEVSAQSVQASCFANCMKPGLKYPGECQSICNNAAKQNNRSSAGRQRTYKNQQQQLIKAELEQQRIWEEQKKAREAARRLEEADAAVQDASRVNLMCYRACYLESQQKVYCEKHCAKSEKKVEGEIYTGDVKIDGLIVECYRGCAERDDLTPACFHTCCYICNKEKYDDEKGFVENPWLTRCKKNCSHKGLRAAECEDICLGGEY